MDKITEKKMNQQTKYVKYKKIWENVPEFEGWIAPLPASPTSAFCTVCRRPLYPSKKDLMKHAVSRKHKLNFARNVSFKDYSQPPSELTFDVMDSKQPYIKCESIDTNLLQASGPSSCNDSEKQSLTIKLFPSTTGNDEQLDLLDESFSLIDDNDLSSTTELFSTSVTTMQSLPQYNDWLTIGENEALCNACNTKFKCSPIHIYKHSIGKVHLEKCAKKSYQVAQTANVYYGNNGSPIKLPSELRSFGKEITIDLRSDSVTLPSDKMREIIVDETVGDTCGITEKSVTELQEKVAHMLQKDDGLIFPSGVMANMAAVITHCWSRDSEVILGDNSQLNLVSNAAITKLCSIPVRTIKNNNDGTFCLDELKEILKSNSDRSQSTTLICIENPLYNIGGKVLPLQWIGKVAKFCEENGIMLHMDGTRLLNASLACGKTPDVIVQSCDTSSFCLDKGLGTPIGCVLVGSKPFINRAKRVRNMLGGCISRMGMFAQAGLHALQKNTPHLSLDHTNARKIAQCVKDLHSSTIYVDLEEVQTNVIHLRADGIRATAASFCQRLAKVSDDVEIMKMGGIKIFILASIVNERTTRLVTHLDLTQLHIEYIMKKLVLTISEYDNTLDMLRLYE